MHQSRETLISAAPIHKRLRYVGIYFLILIYLKFLIRLNQVI